MFRSQNKMAKLALLAKQLQHPSAMGDEFQQRKMLSEVLSYTQQGHDCSLLLPSIVKLLAHRDLCMKKMAAEVLIHHSAHHSEMVLLAINSLIQDTNESNPMIRGLALKTLSSLQQDSVIEHLERIVGRALSDKSAYVRRVAVLACMKLHQMSPSSVKETDLVDTLYGMIRDSDPVVVVNCLAALDEILKDEGGVVINKAIAHYLLSKLDTFPTWSQIQILAVLKRYTPAGDEEMFDIMEVIDKFLDNNSSTVVSTCIDLFFHLAHSFPRLQSEVFRRSQPTLVSHLTTDSVEVSYSVIDIISKAPREALTHFCHTHPSFLCRNKDPLYLKLKVISLLPRLISEENGEFILEQLILYCMKDSQEVSFHALQAIGSIHQQKPFLSKSCQAMLHSLVCTSSVHVQSNLLQILQKLKITDQEFWNQLSSVCLKFASIPDNEGKAAVLYIIGEHLRHSYDAFTVIKDCVEDYQNLEGRYVKHHLLTATAKMFLDHPHVLQHLLGGLLETALKDRDIEVRERAQFLCDVLMRGVDTAEHFLLQGVPCDT